MTPGLCRKMSNSSFSVNSTTNNEMKSPDSTILAEVLPIAVVIVLVNSLVFYLFLKHKMLRTPTNLLLFSLAVCDFLTGFIGIPLFIVVVMQVVDPPVSDHLEAFIAVFNNGTAITTAYHILAITFERYFSILKPFNHRQLTKTSMLKVVISVWFASTALATMPYAWSMNRLSDPIGYSKTQFGYVVFCLTFVFFVPCIMIVNCQFLMFRAISKRGNQGLTSTSASRRKARNDKKCLIVFALMALIFLACWLPWFVLCLCFTLWFPVHQKTLKILLNLAQVFAIFRFVTSIVNPLLYTFFKRDFLAAFRLLILRKKIGRQDRTYVSRDNILIFPPSRCGGDEIIGHNSTIL